MLETSARLLRLLSLLQTPHDWTGADLATRLGIDVRTVRRDIDKLRALGYPVDATPGVAGYRLGAGADLPPLLLDDDEAVAVAIGLRAAAGGTVSGIEESSLRALTKLRQVLPARLRHRVDTLRSVTDTLPVGGPAIDADVLIALATACRVHEQLRFDYTGRDGAPDVRRTEPHRLVHTGRRWYLIAWDLDRDDWRTFRVDRLRPRIPTGPRFTPREAPEAGFVEHTARGISTSAYRYRGRFTLHVPLAVVAEQIPPTAGVLEYVDDSTCSLSAGSDSLSELALYVGLLGHRFEVHEPPELVRHIHELTARLTAAVAASPD
ncbi:helix-turn-helix transcriptional regulator [Streptomyces sp. NPDC057298]|uniref:helix-turn-helix transcriptional regulator n=1 Tax=Streptomyces sp. NPDC057298 TaxID=3346091 RepID=UPI003635287F